MAPNSPQTDALDAVEELKQALAAHGVVLPSLDLDAMSYAYPHHAQLIELGRCNTETALALAAALDGRSQAEGTER
jgi:hypothetical protein